MVDTPAQDIFPPKPKVYSTPLRTVGVKNAVKEVEVEASLQGEPEDGTQGRKATKASAGNKLLREAEE